MGFSLSDIFSGFEDELKDFGRKFDDYVFHGGFEDDLFHGGFEDELKSGLSWVDDQIIKPIYRWQKGFFQAMADDPAYSVIYIATAIYAPHLLPVVVGAKAKSDGAEWGDAIYAGGMAFATQQIATAPVLESVGAKVGSAFTYGLGGGATAAAIGGLIADGTASGLAAGGVAVVSGESFEDGFTSAFIGTIVSAGTAKVLGYVEDKLPQGLKYKTQARNDAGQIIDASGKRVYESKAGTGANGADDITKLVSDNGVVRKAAEVFETFPPVVQDMLSTAITAELQGRDVTPEMMYSVVANTYLTTEVLGGVLSKIPGVDFSSEYGQNFLMYLTPAVQLSVVQAASMGLTEQSGALAMQNVMDAVESYGVDSMFRELFDSVEDNLLVQDLLGAVDTLTGKAGVAQAAADQAQLDTIAYGEAVSEHNSLNNEGYDRYQAYAEEREKYEENGGLAFVNAATAWREGGPATQGFTSFEDYYKAVAQINGYPSIAQIKVGKAALDVAERALVTFNRENEDRIAELSELIAQPTYTTLTPEQAETTDAARLETITNPEDGTETFFLLENGQRIVEIPGGDLTTAFQNSFQAFREAESLMLLDFDDLGDQIIANIVPEVQRDLVLATTPFFDEEYYIEKYGDRFADEINAFGDFTTVGAKEGRFVSQGQADAFEGQAKEIFRLQVAEGLSPGNGMGYLDSVNKNTAARAKFNAEVDRLWQENFFDEFGNFESYKFETIQFVDPQGYATDSAYSDVPVYATLTAEEAAVGDRGWDKVINEDGSETFFLLEGGERVVSGYDSVQNDFVRKPPEAWEATVELVAANVGFFDSIQIRKEDLATQSLDNFSSAELANILSSGGVAYGASGKLEFINITADGDDKFSMFDPVTGESNYLVNGISFDYLKENDTKSYVELTHTAYNAFSERIGVSADAYNADRLAAVELEQMVSNGVIDYSQAIALSYMGIQKKIHSVIAEGMYDTGEFLIDGTIAQFDPDNPYGLLDWSNEGVTAKFDMWSEAINNLEKTTKALPQDTVQAGKTTGALALQGVADLGQSYLSMARFIGNNPADLPAHQFLEEMIGLGESWKSEEWKASAANLSANLAERGVDDPNTPENEAVWGTMQVMGGAFEENPMAFLGEVIFKEGIQEIIPLIVGGGFGYVAARGGARVLGTAVSEKFALNMGFLASTALDIAESAGGTAEGAYQEAYDVIRNSLTAKNSETGYSARQINMIAERYAQDIAVSNGVYAAMVTGAMMFAGGAALDKQVFGTFGSKNINEEAFRTWGTRLNAAFATSGKESITEFAEEFTINDHMEGMLYEWDDTRNITGNNWFAGSMGAIIAGPVTGTMAAFMQPNPEAAATGFTIPDYATATGKQQFASTGSTEADLLLQFNPNIASAVYGNSPTLEADLDALGVNYGVYRALGDAANDPDFTGNPLSVPNPTTEIGRPTVIEPDFDNFPTAEAANDNLHYDVATNTTYRFTNGTWDARGAGDNTSLWGSTPDPVDLDSQLTTLGDVVDRVVTDPTTGVSYRVIHNVVEAEPDAWNAGSLVVTSEARAPVRIFDPSSPYALNGPTVDDVYATLTREFGGDITAEPAIGDTEISVSDALSHDGIYAGGDIVSLNGLMRASNVMASHTHAKISRAMNALRTAGTSLSDQEHAEDLLDEAKESLGKYYSVMEDWLPAIRSTRSFLGLGPTIDNLGGNFAGDGDGVMEIPGRFATYFFNGEIPYEFSTRGSSSGTLNNASWGITSVGGLNEKFDSYFSNEALVMRGNSYVDILNDGTGNYIAKERYTGLSKIDPANLSIWEDNLLEARAAEESALADLNGAMTEGDIYGGTGGDPYADRFEQPYYDALDARYNAEADYEFFYDKVMNQDEQYLKLFRSKAVENGWTISDSNNYILRNGEDILETMDSMTSEPGNWWGARYLQEDLFDNYFVNNTDTSKNFATIDASPRLSLNQFKDIFIRDNGLSEAEYYAALGPGMGATNEEKDANVKAFYLDAVRDPNDLDAFGNPVVGIQAESPEVISFIDSVVNTEAEVIAAYKAELGQDYVPTAEEIDKYIGATFSLDGDGVAVYDNPLSAIDDAFTSENEITDIMRGFGYTSASEDGLYYYYNPATGDRITSAEASEIIDPRKTVAENSTAYREYFDDLGAPVTAEELAIQQLGEVLSNKDAGIYKYFLGKIEESHAANGSAYLNAFWGGHKSLESLLQSASNYELTRAQVEESFVQQFGSLGVSREDSDFDAQVDAYISEQGITLGTNATQREPILHTAAQAKWITTFQNILDDADVTDFEVTERNANAFKNRTNPVEEFTTYAEQQKRNQDARIEASTTLSNGTAQAVLITRFGMSNMTWDAEQGKNVPNQEMADIIAKHFELGEGAEGSALERLNAGIDAYRTELMESRGYNGYYAYTPTQEQLDRLRGATTSEWINDPEIQTAIQESIKDRGDKSFSPRELSYLLADEGISYTDPMYMTLMNGGYTGEGGGTFDVDQRAIVLEEIARLREEQSNEAVAAQQLADTKQAFADAGYTPTDLEIEQFLTDNAGIPDFITNTVKPRVEQDFIDAGYNPSEQDITDYLNNTAGIAGFVQGKRNDTAALFGDYNPSEQDITDYLNNNAGVAGFVQGKRNDTAALFGDYTPTPQEITDYLNNNEGVAGFVQGKRNATAALFGDYTPTPQEITDYLNNNEGVAAYLEPKQYTRDEAKADLAAELGISVGDIDEETYGVYLDSLVDMTGARTNVQGNLQVQGDITNVADVRSYLEGLDYDTTGLSNEQLLAFAGTGLDTDLGTVTSDYQTANETITQREARLADEAKVAALETEIKGYLDDPSQDGGAYTDPDHYDNIVKYLSSGAGRESFEAMDAAQRKNRVQVQSIDPRRYSESEAVADIKAAFPADAGLSVEDLKAKYPTLFALVGDGNLSPTTHEANQKVAFDEGTVTGDEANDYFRDVLGYGEGWIPSGNIASRLVGVGNEATVLPTDIANLTGKTLDLYNETTVTQDEVIGAMIANPAGFGFADAAAVAEAVSNGLDLSAYTGNYWQAGAEGSAGDTGKSLAARLDDATVSQDEIDAYLTEQGYDPATAGTFDSSLGFGTTSVEDITSSYRGDVDADRVEEAAVASMRADIEAAMDDATQDGGAYTAEEREGLISWFSTGGGRAGFEGKTTEERKQQVQRDIDNRRYSESEVAEDLRTAFPADAGLSVEDLKVKYAGAFDLVKEGAYATDGEQRTAFDAATTTEAEARASLEGQEYVIPEGFDFTNFTGVMDNTQLANNVYQYLSPLQYTRADAEAALAAELGRPLTADDLTTYKDYLDGLVDMTGARTNAQGDLQVQGDITSQADINAVLLGAGYSQADIDAFNFDDLIGLDTDLDTELSGFTDATRTVEQQDTATDLLGKGWTGASDADIAEVQDLDSAGRDAWVAERQFTREQATTALAAQGIYENHPQFENFITQLVVDKGAAGTFGTQGALVDDPEDALIDQYIITQAEIDAETGGYSYFDFAQTPLGVTPGVADDTTLASTVSEHVGNNYVQADAAREALNGIAGVDAYEQDLDGNYVITDDQLVGLGLVGQYDPTTLGTKVDGATTTEAEVIAAFGENYNPTDAEIARYMGLLPDGDIGTTIPAYVANRMDTLVSDVGDLSLTVSQLEDRLNGAFAEGGSLDLAVSQVANDLGIAEEALLKLIGDNSNKFDDLETAFGTQASEGQEATGIWANIAGLEDDISGLQDAFGTQGVVDDPNTLDIDESSPATGIYGIIDQVAEGVLSNDEAITLLEGAVGVPATYAEDGVTVLTPATGIYAQSGTGVNADVLQAINAVYEYVGQADFASDTTVQQVADLLGKPADLVTQDDIDYATQITQDNITATFEDSTGSPDLTYDALYDVNNDGFINGTDVNLMVDLYGGVDAAYNNVVEGLPEGSRFASTGVFGILDQQNRNQTAANEAIANQAEIDAQTNADTLADINTQVNANINVQNQRYLQELLAEEARLGGSRRIDTTNKDPGDIEYMYDFEGIFANQGQEDLYGNLFGGEGFGLREKAAATGGLIDSTDELLKILGK